MDARVFSRARHSGIVCNPSTQGFEVGLGYHEPLSQPKEVGGVQGLSPFLTE